MRLPNLIVAGVSKAGTTSLFDYLGRHPEIGQSDHKELRYFSPLRYGGLVGPVEGYARHFVHLSTELYAMESTPGYFYGGRQTAESMVRTLGSVKVIVSLREPGDRCHSWFRFMKARLRLPKTMTFEEYIERCAALHYDHRADRSEANAPYFGLGGGCYDEWLTDWSNVIGSDLRVVFFEDLASDPVAMVTDLMRWLKLEPDEADLSDLVVENKTEPYRLQAAQRAAILINRHGERFFRAHPHLKRRLRSGYYALNKAGNGDVMTPAAREQLDGFYAPHNERLAVDLANLGLTAPWLS